MAWNRKGLTSIIFKRDDGQDDQMTVTSLQALRIKRLAVAKGLPQEAVMNVIAGQLSRRLDDFLKSQGV